MIVPQHEMICMRERNRGEACHHSDSAFLQYESAQHSHSFVAVPCENNIQVTTDNQKSSKIQISLLQK